LPPPPPPEGPERAKRVEDPELVERVEGAPTTLTRAYDLITGDEDARVCADIPESACRDVPANFFLHLSAQIATKTGDQLASARLVLAWLLTSLGAPAFMTGLLVPIRESLALLPQLAVAGLLRRAARRKWFWVAGSVAQGLCVAGMAFVAAAYLIGPFDEMKGPGGAAAAWIVLALLAAFSLARGVCSVTGKDVLGKTVPKTRRGTLMGYAAAVAGVVTLVVGLIVNAARERSDADGLFVVMLAAAAFLWLSAAALFGAIREAPGATAGGGSALRQALASLKLLGSDRAFRAFVVTRTLLLSTALAQPFYVVLAREHGGDGLAGLGLLIVAAGLAQSLSAPVWGRMADRSSRRVLVAAALAAGATGLGVFAASRLVAVGPAAPYVFALLFLALAVAHSGVRLGRKTYLLDMATVETRAAYVAVSNTIIGLLLLLGGSVGLLADRLGPDYAVLLLALLSLVAALRAVRLPEVQRG